jgi:hypothetical protein
MYILQHLICFFLIHAFLKLPDLLGNSLNPEWITKIHR